MAASGNPCPSERSRRDTYELTIFNSKLYFIKSLHFETHIASTDRLPDRPDESPKIEPEGGVLHIADIEFQPLLPGQVVPPTDPSETCNPRADEVSLILPCRVMRQILGQRGRGPTRLISPFKTFQS